ncbi:MAG: hypothetical protein O9272_06945, partial [Brevundimonas sp.]|nr:hypothetical protein [Brevundimonas sp.]
LDQLLHGDDGSRHSHFLSGLLPLESWDRAELPLRNRYVRFPCGFAVARGIPVQASAPLTASPRQIQPKNDGARNSAAKSRLTVRNK